MAEQNLENQVQEIEVMAVETPTNTTEVVPINYEAALASYTEEERQEIVRLADSIDVRKLENTMSYGTSVLKRTFDQCGEFLKSEKGSEADQKVIAQVIELSKKAAASYDDFNLVLQEPGFFQKILLKFTSGGKSGRTEKIQNSAITSYKLLSELKASCESWISMLQDAYGEIQCSAMNDVETIGLLEKYIIAGKMAEERIGQEMVAIEAKHKETGLQRYIQDYEELKEGFDIFKLTMTNLEKSRVMYQLSIGQLALVQRGNRNVQISIRTQMNNSMALIGQQLRNAILNAKTQEVLDGQKAITRLNDELIKEVSKTVGLTAEDTEKLIYAGFYNMEAAKEAVATVISSCEAIKKTATEMLPKMTAELEQVNALMKELEPCIDGSHTETLKIEGGKAATAASSSTELKF